MEGGGFRGVYTAGVLDFFIDRKAMFSSVYGISAGACNALNYLSQDRGRYIEIAKRFCNDPRYMGVGQLLKTGSIFNWQFSFYEIPERYIPYDYDTFEKYPGKAYSVVTNIETGHAEYPLIENVFEQMDTLRASASLPFVSKPVAVGDGLYLDGGIVDSIPFEAMRTLGYDRLVVVLTRDGSYRKGPMPSLPIDLWYGKYPALQQRLRCRHEAYNQSLDRLRQLEQDGVAKVIRPRRPIEMGRLERDPAVLQRVYDQGYAGGQKTEL